jgi:Family of unknown function (DUF6394)
VNLREVVFGFFVVLAATLSFGFFVGDISDPTLHHPAWLIAAVAANLLTTALKWGDRTHWGAVYLATSLTADLQLIAALAVLSYSGLVSVGGMTGATTAVVVSLSGGALLANLVSVAMLVLDVASSARK